MEKIYLDHSAATPIHPEVLGEMMSFHANHFGNPLSIHREGRRAREAVAAARARVAALIGADPAEIVFTGGGTEADNLAILGTARAVQGGRNHIVTTLGEHPAVIQACRHLRERGFAVTFLPVDEAGRIDPGAIEAAITARTFLVSVCHADGRSGTLQPLRGIAAVLRGRGILLHADAVQSAGKVPLAVDGLGVDLLSLAGDLIYGPKGTGALYVRRGTAIEPIGFGAGQEGNLRPGTENVPGVVGLGKACEIAGRDLETQRVQLEGLRGLLAEKIRAGIDGVRINGQPTERLPHLLSVSIPGMSGESLVRALDLRGIAVSNGAGGGIRGGEDPPAATGAGRAGGPARGTLLFGLGRNNTPGEMLQAAAALARLVNGQRLSAKG
jgi:cysteine desulfurase